MRCTIAASSVKRARLFSPTPNPVIVGATPSRLPTPSESIELAATNITPVPSLHVQDSPAQGEQSRVMEEYNLKLNLQKAVRDCRKAILERDTALARTEEVLEDLRNLRDQYNEAIQCKEMVTIERNKAISELELALKDCEESATKYNDAKNDGTRWKELYLCSEKRCDNLVQEMRQLQDTNSRLNGLFSTLTQEQSELISRVHNLETRAASNTSGLVGAAQSPKYPVRAVLNLTSKLFPFVEPRKRLQSFFDMLYASHKSFQKHVHHKVKGSLMESMCISCCREIKQYYNGWKF